jgi:hypothetical protein
MTAFRLGRRAPASFDAAADQRFKRVGSLVVWSKAAKPFRQTPSKGVAFAGLFFLVESGQGPFDSRRQKAWLLPAIRWHGICFSADLAPLGA